MSGLRGGDARPVERETSRRQFLETATGIGVGSVVGVEGGRADRISGGDVVWRFETDQWVRSSPTVVGGTVFVGTGSNDPDKPNYVTALDAETGDEQWHFETDFWVRSSPTVVGGTVFVGSDDTNVYALDAATGDEQWHFETDDTVHSSPTVADGTVFVGSDDANVYALDAATGDEQWRFNTGGGVGSSPTVVAGTVFVGTSDGDGHVYALDAATGDEQWRFETAYRTEQWRSRTARGYETDSWFSGSPTVVGDTVFVGGFTVETDVWSGIYALDATTGDEQWKRGSVKAKPLPTVTVADSTVFVGTASIDPDKPNYVTALDAETGDEQWRFETGDNVTSVPTVVDGLVFVGSLDYHVYALDAETGDKQWRFETNRGVSSSPTVVDGTVFVGSNNGNVYALDAGVDGSSEDSRVLLGTLGHHNAWAEHAPTGESPVPTPEPTPTPKVTPEPTPTPKVTPTSTLGPEEEKGLPITALEIGSLFAVGGIVAAGGALAWWRRAGDSDDGDTVPSSEDVADQPGEPTDIDPTNIAPIDDQLDKVDADLTYARRAWQDRKYDRALDACQQSIDFAEDTLEIASEEVPDLVAEVETRLDDAKQLYEEIETEQQAYELITTNFEAIEKDLDAAAEALDTDDLPTSRQRLDDADATVDDAVRRIGEHDFPALDSRLVDLRNRHDQLQERTRRASEAAKAVAAIDDLLDDATSSLETARQSRNEGEYAQALQACERAIQATEDAREKARDGAPDRVETIEDHLDDIERLQEEITAEQEIYQDADGTIDDIADDLDAITETLEDDPEAALQQIDDLVETIDETVDRIQDFPDLADEHEQLRDRRQTLRQKAGNTLVDDRIDEIETALDEAENARDDGDYERALDACEQAIRIARTTHERASEEVPDRVDDLEAYIEEADELRDETRAERYTRQEVIETLGSVVEMFQSAAAALDDGESERARRQLDDADDSLDEAADCVKDAGLPDIRERIERLHDRRAELDEEARAAMLDDHVAAADSNLTEARAARDDREYGRALETCRNAIQRAETARELADEADSERESEAQELRDEAERLRESIETERDTYRTLRSDLAGVVDTLDEAEVDIETGEPERAIQYLDGVDDALTDAVELVNQHDFSDLVGRAEDLQERTRQLRERAEDILSPVPEKIPAPPKREFGYGDLEKVEPIGSGGNADVYLAAASTDQGDLEVALKEPRMSGTLHTGTVERLLQEAETWQKLDDHDHVVGIVDYGAEPLPWIAMEYMDAGHVGDRAGKLDLDQALWTAIATTKAVRHAHRRGVAHLDLKPANILFRSVEDAWDVPKVADWGLSKQLLEHSKSVEGFSPTYAAPEQFDDGYGSVDDLTDVYQLGAVLYELFTGRPPFEGQPFEVMHKVKHEDPSLPSDVADVPSGLDDIVLTAMATEKSGRYESVLYLRDRLQELSESI